MWVYRGVLYVQPGLMAEAIAHGKTRTPPEGVGVRVLRPINGEEANTKLIVEYSFEDPDAFFAGTGSPQPADAWMKRWIELNQSRGSYELYEVRQAIEPQGQAGLWVERRVRYVKDGWKGEALRRWLRMPAVTAPGYSFRLLTCSTGERAGNILVVEGTCDSLVGYGARLGQVLATPEGSAWAASVKALEMCEPTMELYRVVP